MEFPGIVPPDRDSYNSCQQSSTNFNTTLSSGHHSISTSSSVGVSVAGGSNSATSTQQPFERLSRPMSFDKVINSLDNIKKV